MDREHAGGEIQRLGGVGALQAPGDELVAPRGAGLGGAGSGATQRGTRRLASGSCAARASVARTDPQGRLIAVSAHQLASARIFSTYSPTSVRIPCQSPCGGGTQEL